MLYCQPSAFPVFAWSNTRGTPLPPLSTYHSRTPGSSACPSNLEPGDCAVESMRGTRLSSSLERSLFFQFPDDAIVYQVLGLEPAKLFVGQREHANAVTDPLHRRIDPFRVELAHEFIPFNGIFSLR